MNIKKLFSLILIVISTIFICTASVKVEAAVDSATNGIPYTTYTLGVNNSLTPTQTAYIPVGVIGSDLNLKNASDIYYYNQSFYIADTDNKRILKISKNGQLEDTYSSDEFISPMGVFVTDEAIYVADKGAKTVFKIEHQIVSGQASIMLRVTRPTSAIYGNNDFVPTKVAVKANRNMYIIGEGSTNGIIEVNYQGEFLGYLGINSVDLSLRRILYDFFVSSGTTASTMPAAPTNVAIGQKGSILSLNQNVTETFKRLNITGINTLQSSTLYPAAVLSDIIMSEDYYIYMVAENGGIYEYDSNGNLIFTFNTNDSAKTQVLGLTSKPSGISVDESGNIYCLDASYNNIQVYQKTFFVELVHEAVTMYNDGRYLESKPLWEEILRQNTSFALAHTALGSALSKEGRFDEALAEFEIAKDYNGYSSAYWEIRNERIQSNLPVWIVIIVVVAITLFVLVRLYKRTAVFDRLKQTFEKIKQKKLMSELLYGSHIFKHPSDSFFEIKRKNKASVLSGTIILIAFILIYLIDIYCSGFLFTSGQSLSSVFMQLGLVVGIFFLFVIVNYFVSALNDGEGRLKDIYIAACYSLMPFIILTLPMTLLSHVLTYNEQFIISFYDTVVILWTVFLLIYSIKEIHNYSFKKTIASTLIIIFGMIIIVVIGLLVYSFVGQLIEFIVSIVREVIYRA